MLHGFHGQTLWIGPLHGVTGRIHKNLNPEFAGHFLNEISGSSGRLIDQVRDNSDTFRQEAFDVGAKSSSLRLASRSSASFAACCRSLVSSVWAN